MDKRNATYAETISSVAFDGEPTQQLGSLSTGMGYAFDETTPATTTYIGGEQTQTISYQPGANGSGPVPL